MKPEITDYDVITAMERYGGSFASSLAVACFHADEQNLARIKLAFVNLWREYYKLAEKDRENKDENPPF